MYVQSEVNLRPKSVRKIKITMGWFASDNYVTNNVELATTEVKIMVGASVALVVILVAYLSLRIFNKYNKRGMQSTVQHEIRSNNIRVDADRK